MALLGAAKMTQVLPRTGVKEVYARSCLLQVYGGATHSFILKFQLLDSCISHLEAFPTGLTRHRVN